MLALALASAIAVEPVQVPVNDVVVVARPSEDGMRFAAAAVAHGQLVEVGDTLAYVPPVHFVGRDTASYDVVVDGVTVEVVDLAIDVVGTEPRGRPAPVPDRIHAYAGVPIIFSALANDGGRARSMSIVGTPLGTATRHGPAIMLTPSLQDLGRWTGACRTRDAHGNVYVSDLHIDVLPRPVATDDRAFTTTNTPVTVPVFDNDQGRWASATCEPEHGACSIDRNGLHYQPALDYRGWDHVTYRVTDRAGTTVHAIASISVRDVWFEDVTEAAGIDYVQNEITDDVVQERLWMTGGAAAGDCDGDGDVDLFATRLDDRDLLYVNQGDGTFVDLAPTAGIEDHHGSNGAAWIDVDNDNDLDLYVTVVDAHAHRLYINDGDCTFTEQGVSRSAVLAGTELLYGTSVTAGDVDGDGYLDLHIAEWRHDGINPNQAPSHTRLLRNLGASSPGHFEDITGPANVTPVDPRTSFAFAPRFADLDDDGLLDLAIVADFGTSRLLWNEGDGTFTDGTSLAGVGTDENGMGSVIADLDNDGRLDWFVTSIWDPADTCATEPCGWGGTGNRLYLNEGMRQFRDATDQGVRDGGWGWAASAFDHDNDGDLDIVQTNGVDFPHMSIDGPFEQDPMKLFVNDGTATFAEEAAASGLVDTGSGKGLLTFDYDGDGDLDVFIVRNGDQPILYRNHGGNTRSWLRLELQPWAAAIGARVHVEAVDGGTIQTREVNVGSNFLGQDDTVVHVGLGPDVTTVHALSIHWPDGETTVMQDIPANDTVVIMHP